MMISRKITSESAASTRVLLMFSKTLIASAAKPAPPVIFTSRPPPGLEASSRQASIGSRMLSASPSPLR